MTFLAARAAIAANPAGPFLRVDHFGELVTYQPAGGGPARTVRAHCQRTKAQDDAETIRDVDREELIVKLPRDRTTEQANGYDAVDDPQEGDILLRPGDSPDHPWTYQGQAHRNAGAPGETPHTWYLLFARHRPNVYR